MEPKENLAGKKVAILATDGFEASELMKPREALLEAGADVQIVAPHDGEIRSWKDKDWGDYVKVDRVLHDVKPEWPSLKTDIQNAGALWVDREVVTANGLVTSRKPDDIPAFNRQMIEEFAEGVHRPPVRSESRDSLLNRML